MARYDNPDMDVVNAIIRGVPLPEGVRPSYADRLAVIRHLARNGFTDPQIAELMQGHCSERTVHRVRSRFGIVGQPVGTNGFTRRHNSVGKILP